jgi:hypothetical protein
MPGLYDQVDAHLDEDDSQPVKPFFDRLSKQLDDNVTGLTTTDLISLKGAQKAVMLFMLRNSEAATQGITLQDLRESLPDVADVLPKAVTELANQGWLFLSGESPNVRYRVHMRRTRRSELGLGIWSTLASRFAEHKDK